MKGEEILEELRRIRELLEQACTPPPRGFWAGFLDFISKYKVMGMAVAFILGVYLGALVKALVDDIIMPLVQFATPNVAWEAIEIGHFRVGHFVGSVITFILIAFVVFLLVKVTKRFKIG